MSSMWPYTPNYRLEGFLESQYGDAEPACWLGGAVDQSEDYCRTCAEKAVAAGKGEFVDGGWGANEVDSTPFCEGCGCLLSGWFTDYGAQEELRHWRENPPRGRVGPIDEHCIARLLNARPNCPETRWLAEQAAAAIVRAQS